MKEEKIHYIGKEWNPIFIVAKTKCGKYWEDINEHTSDLEYVTCKSCLKKLNQEDATL
jgi:hypothetical protein